MINNPMSSINNIIDKLWYHCIMDSNTKMNKLHAMIYMNLRNIMLKRIHSQKNI